MTAKIIICMHGLTRQDRTIEIPFEFSAMRFYCDEGFKLTQPVVSSNKFYTPWLLIDSIARNKIIPRRETAGEWQEVSDLDREINKLKYVPDPETNTIKLPDMWFSVPVTDRQSVIFRENIGIYFCSQRSEPIKLMGLDNLFSLITEKAKRFKTPISKTYFNWNDLFGILRDLISNLRINLNNTEICMVTCRGYDSDPISPFQTPIVSN